MGGRATVHATPTVTILSLAPSLPKKKKIKTAFHASQHCLSAMNLSLNSTHSGAQRFAITGRIFSREVPFYKAKSLELTEPSVHIQLQWHWYSYHFHALSATHPDQSSGISEGNVSKNESLLEPLRAIIKRNWVKCSYGPSLKCQSSPRPSTQTPGETFQASCRHLCSEF